jgi:hypothetical protein
MLARKGQRAVAIKCSFMPLGPAADATRRRSRSLERTADRAGWRTASPQQASKACCPKVNKLAIFPVQGRMAGLVSAGNFSVPKHGKFPPRKAAIRWLVTASDGGRFERLFDRAVAQRVTGKWPRNVALEKRARARGNRIR